MARDFVGLTVKSDRGDGKCFVQAEWKNEFQQSQTKEVADSVAPGLLVALRNIIENIQGMVEREEV